MPFSCPYNHCERTFSGRAALREHVKSHKGQSYWETLNRISENCYENEIEGMVPYLFFIKLFLFR